MTENGKKLKSNLFKLENVNDDIDKTIEIENQDNILKKKEDLIEKNKFIYCQNNTILFVEGFEFEHPCKDLKISINNRFEVDSDSHKNM